MKKRFIILTLIIISMVISYHIISQLRPQAVESTQTSSEAPVSIIIATDLHYLSKSLHDNDEFFTNLINNADGKNMFYIEEITEAFVSQVIKQKPEFLIISGDLTFNGEKQSHIGLEKKLKRLENAGITVLVMPGNHDIDRSSAAKFIGKSYTLVDSISSREYSNLYKYYGLQEALQKDDSSLSYVYSARKDLWFLFLDTNSKGDNRLSPKTLNWVKKRLHEAKRLGIKVISITHQNLLAHNPNFNSGFVIDQAPVLNQLYKDSNVLLNLSGHIHIQHIKSESLPEIVTSSLAVSPHQYGEITYDGNQLHYQIAKVDVEKWARSKGSNDNNLLNFTETSHLFMKEVAKRKTKDWENTNISEEQLELAKETFASLNAAYFAGTPIDANDHKEGLSIITKYFGGFVDSYLESILLNSNQQHHELSLLID